MDQRIKINKGLWDGWTDIHAQSEVYDLKAFRNGKCSLNEIEKQEIGEVNGKSLLHLQCHFGMDTISWARKGAIVTGVDLSEKSIDLARSLSREMEIDAKFICSNIFSLPDKLKAEFDIVYTSYGVLR